MSEALTNLESKIATFFTIAKANNFDVENIADKVAKIYINTRDSKVVYNPNENIPDSRLLELINDNYVEVKINYVSANYSGNKCTFTLNFPRIPYSGTKIGYIHMELDYARSNLESVLPMFFKFDDLKTIVVHVPIFKISQ